MSFDVHEVHAELHAIFKQLDYSRPPFSTSHAIETLFPQLDVIGAPLDEFARIEVFAEPLPSGKRGIITYDDKSAAPTHRFSIAHEIAHWIFDFRRGEALAHVECGRRGGKSIAEQRADYFAAEFCAPLWILDQHVKFKLHADESDPDEVAALKNHAQRMASRFNVSLRCMQMRLRDLSHWRQMRRGR